MNQANVDMRKYLTVIVLLLMALPGHADRLWYRATSYAEATLVDGHFYWGPWRETEADMCFDAIGGRITIYGQAKQVYLIDDFCNDGNPYSDGEGGDEYKLFVTSQGGDNGTVRVRFTAGKRIRIYVDMPGGCWVYDVKSIK